MTVELYIEKLGTYIKTNNPKYDKDSHVIIIEKWIKEDKEDTKQAFGEDAEHINIDDWYKQAESYDPRTYVLNHLLKFVQIYDIIDM